MLDSVENQNDPLALKIKHSHHPEIIADFIAVA